MHVLLAFLGLLLLIPAALAGIATGLRDLTASSNTFASQLDQLLTLGQSLLPACGALALIVVSLLALAASVWLLARSLQLRT